MGHSRGIHHSMTDGWVWVDVTDHACMCCTSQVDQCSDPDAVMEVAKGREDVVAVSASQASHHMDGHSATPCHA